MACPAFKFSTHPSTSPFLVSCETFLSTSTRDLPYAFIATGAILFDASEKPRILLIQRAAHDSMGSRWEIPGGGCDNDDTDILHGVARELWEETGLIATRIGPRVGGDHLFSTRSGKVVCKFNFLVEAEKNDDGHYEVKLDPNEHEAYVWAGEEEIKAYKVGNTKLEFTTREQEQVILEAFQARKTAAVKTTS